jgi:flagellar hook protein FlgE
MRKKGRSSFLKKRSKKLLLFCQHGTRIDRETAPTSKSLFASFSSEKEDLPCLPAARQNLPGINHHASLMTPSVTPLRGAKARGTIYAKSPSSAPLMTRNTAMSLLGAMSTAISGLDAQSAAFTNISDNVANSQTVGFKGVDTNFIDYLTTSTATTNLSGSVDTTPEYLNNVQGSISQSADPLALAIDGQGFFAVSEQNGTGANDTPTFNQQQFYTRAGDFTLNAQGYLQNSAGAYLNGYTVDPATGQVNSSTLAPITVTQTQFQPVATSSVSLLANVPATPSSTSNLSSQVSVYDATGTAHQLTTTWTQNSANNWTLTLSSPDDQTGPTTGTVNVTFGPNGTLQTLSTPTGNVAVNGTGSGSGGAATVTLTPTFNGTAQPITLNLGTFGGSSGVTQFAGTDYSLYSINQNRSAPGSFTGISTSDTGAVTANYNNGQSVTVAQIPVITFADPNALQRQNGQAFTSTLQSGVAIAQNQDQNGAGTLVAGSVEQSNVDIATQLSALIVAQEAYGANAKVISTANEMLETTLQVKQ